MENDKKLIKAVNDRNDKKETYCQQMGKYKRAMSNGFYFEAMLITYAMIEDRMRSFLYYIGAFRREDDPNLNVSITKPLLRNLYYGSEENAKGKKLDITGVSKGKGTQGNIKRHGHHRGPMTHGSKHKRLPGGLAAGTYPSRVFKGNKAPGRMGRETTTVQNRELVKVLADRNVVLVKGSVPGPRGGLLKVKYAVKGQK